MKNFSCLILVFVLLLAGCGDKANSSAPATTNTSSSGSVADAPGDYLKGMVKAQRDATMLVDTNSLAKLVDQFNIDKGRNPKDLDELVQEKYISKLPEPPFGTKLAYDPVSGIVSIVKQ